MTSQQSWGGNRPGSGRKPIGGARAVGVSVNIPPDLLEKIEARAAAEGKSRSKVILEIIQNTLGGRSHAMSNTEKYKTIMSAVRAGIAMDARKPKSILLSSEDFMFMWKESFNTNINDKAEVDSSGNMWIDGIQVKNDATVAGGMAFCAYPDGSTNNISL